MVNGEHSNWKKNVKGKLKRQAEVKKGTLAEGRRVGTLHRTLENFGILVLLYQYFAGFRSIRGFFDFCIDPAGGRRAQGAGRRTQDAGRKVFSKSAIIFV